jgi:hypothetical protein
MTLALPKQIFKNLGYKNEIKVLFHFYETQNGVPLEVLPKSISFGDSGKNLSFLLHFGL